jgi:hypothetical protein
MNVIAMRILVTALLFALVAAGSAAAEPKLEPGLPAPDLIERVLLQKRVVARPDDRAGARTSLPTVVSQTADDESGFAWAAAGIGASVAFAIAFAFAVLRLPRRVRGLARAVLMVSALLVAMGSASPPAARAEKGCVGTHSSHYGQLGLRDEVAHTYTRGISPTAGSPSSTGATWKPVTRKSTGAELNPDGGRSARRLPSAM